MNIKEQLANLLPKQEKSLRKAIWWMLQELHQENDVALSKEFDFKIVGQEPAPKQQRRAIRFLKNLGVLEILWSSLSTSGIVSLALKMRSELGEIHEPVLYGLRVNRDALLETCQAYEDFFEKSTPDYLSFDTKTGTLIYKDKKVLFSPNSQSFSLLDVLINNTDSYYALGDTLGFKEINDIATQDGAIEKIPDKAFYNIYKHINEKIEKEASIGKFLILREATIGLNNELLEN